MSSDHFELRGLSVSPTRDMTFNLSSQPNATTTKKPMRMRPKSSLMTPKHETQSFPIELSIQPSNSYNTKPDERHENRMDLELLESLQSFVPVAAEEGDELFPEWNDIMQEEIPNTMVNLDSLETSQLLSAPFLDFLHHQATTIQTWYRYHKSRKSKASTAKLEALKQFRHKYKTESAVKSRGITDLLVADAKRVVNAKKSSTVKATTKRPVTATKEKSLEKQSVANKISAANEIIKKYEDGMKKERKVVKKAVTSTTKKPERKVKAVPKEEVKVEEEKAVEQAEVDVNVEPVEAEEPDITLKPDDAPEEQQEEPAHEHIIVEEETVNEEISKVEDLQKQDYTKIIITESSEPIGSENVIEELTKENIDEFMQKDEIITAEPELPVIEKETEQPTPVQKDPTSLLTSLATTHPTSSTDLLDLHFTTTEPIAAEDATNKRIDRILDYLRNVEEDDIKSVAATEVSRTTSAQLNSHVANITASVASVGGDSSIFDGVKAKLVSQQLEIEEKTRTLTLLKRELKRLKEVNKEQHDQYRKDIKSKLGLQRKEYEGIIKRHLSFIDKLLAEKDSLSQKCSTLTEEVKTIEKQFTDKYRNLDEHHQREMKQQRELWNAGEKIRREKWIQEQTKRIKDQTVKGLEPEIQRMLAQHKYQLRQSEEKFQELLSKEKESLNEQHQRQIEQLREKFTIERQRACEEEREFARQRYQKQLERDEMEYQGSKRKLLSQFQEEKDALIAVHKEEKRAEEVTYKKTIEELRKDVEREKQAKLDALEEVKRKNNGEMNGLREKLEIEKEEWMGHFIQKKEEEMRQKEKQFKEKLIKERDAEIEMIVQRLESETVSNNSDIYRRHRMEIEKIKSTHAEESKHLRDQHSLALDKVLVAQKTVEAAEKEKRDAQKELLRWQHECESKDNLLRNQKTELDRLRGDESTLVAKIREDFESQFQSQNSQMKSLETQLNQLREQTEILRRKHTSELEAAAREKDEAISLLETRVRKTIALKDEVIGQLRSQIEELKVKNTTLETLMEKQRHELLA